jgi:hypothetical protein
LRSYIGLNYVSVIEFVDEIKIKLTSLGEVR